ncbi:MAG: helix-turn-helix domain-containing protein [Burkholderiaceae bacterium]|nr:helix-turn-helix domain-containing protein [Burkholderiaceae bacterium]
MSKKLKSVESEDAEAPIEEGHQRVPEDGLGLRIKDARVTRGLSIEGVSKLSKYLDIEKRGISRPVLSGYEKGTYKPGTRELRILYATLGVSPNWLVLGESDPEKKAMWRARFNNEDEFFQQLQEAMKRLEPNALDGLASVIFNASVGTSTIKEDLINPIFNLLADMGDKLDTSKLEIAEFKKSFNQALSEKDKKIDDTR